MDDTPKKSKKKKKDTPTSTPQSNALATIAVVRMTHVFLPLGTNHLMIGPTSIMTPEIIRKRVPDHWVIKRIDVFTVPVKQLISSLQMAGIFEQPVNG